MTARNHCITASKAHDVMSRMVTYRRNFDETDFISVIDKVSDKTYFFYILIKFTTTIISMEMHNNPNIYT